MAEHIPQTTVVNIRNLTDDQTYKWGWDSNWWVLEPGKSIVAPYFGFVNWLGDPRAVNIGDPDANQEVQYRSNEVRRLGVLYGIYDRPWHKDTAYKSHDHTDTRPADDGMRDHVDHTYVQRPDGRFWHPHLPCVEVTDLSGNVIRTIIDDPEGNNLTPADATTKAEKGALEAQMAEMQSTLASLQLQLAVKNNALQANPDFEGDVAGSTDQPAVQPVAREEEIPRATVDQPSAPSKTPPIRGNRR